LIAISLPLGENVVLGGSKLEGGPTVAEVESAAEQVRQEVSRLKGDDAPVEPIKAEAVARLFPKYLFFAVRYRLYPVARMTPPPLKSANLFLVAREKGARARLVNDKDSLEAFFRESLPPLRDDAAAKDAVRAWLVLAEALLQDGFYLFELQHDSIKVTPTDSGKRASGRAVVMRGGNGELRATLNIDSSGKLAGVEQQAKLRSGPRPICQAKKLLDPDSIVRAMAEQDLLYMGPAAKQYLAEQRASATPELQHAIDELWERICAEGGAP
jgi:hypothetical protein